MTVQRHLSPGGTYSNAVVVDGPGSWIHLAGMLGLDADGALVEGGMYEESAAAFKAIDRTLASVGASLKDVVRINAFLTDLDRYAEFGRARAEAFRDAPPASAAVGVSRLLMDACVEIEAIAFVSEPSASGEA